ncbi:MAG: alpha/beta fold hydrolase [Pseudonocardiales bacterium]|nr:alpha/beta fold hydrolase [Hyphomicrobiales bacterium]MBV8825508.1 alpha/beta fold hydrolase [Hyphomicrobiales bacterium]MBV9429434.1 alpha/beta fold hydrolase [Bradyrhizobiaceae bacterium]MBV9728102.1 alpha/beta fold hydrolase [Pseudonocardiales bacterium]
MFQLDHTKGNMSLMRLAMPDRADIAFRFFHTSKVPKAVAVVLHGTGMHGGYYLPFARCLANEGVQVALMDQRGHGLSGGERGHIRRRMQYADDLADCLAAVHDAHPLPLFALAHSGAAAILLKALPLLPAGLLSGIALLTPTFANDGALVRSDSAGKGRFDSLKYMLRPDAARPVEQSGDHNKMTFAYGKFLLAQILRLGTQRTVLTYRPPASREPPYGYSAAAVAGCMIGQLEHALARISCPIFLATGDNDVFVHGAAVQTVLPWALAPDVPFSAVNFADADHFTTLLRSVRHLGAWILANVTTGASR